LLHVPFVRRLIGQHAPQSPPPLISPLVRGMRSVGESPNSELRRPARRVEEPTAPVASYARQVTDEPSVGDEAVKAALAGIAAELAASEPDERKGSWWRFTLGSGALLAIVLIGYIVRESRSDRREGFQRVVTSTAEGRVGKAATTAPSPLAPRSIAIDTSSAAVRDTALSATPSLADDREVPTPTPRPAEVAKAGARHPARASAATPSPKEPSAIIGGIVVSPTTVRVGVSRRTTLTATVIDEFGKPLDGSPVAWTSSKRRVATVSSNGILLGRAPGTTKITATSGGKKASVFVTVTAGSARKQEP
jgi:hypothetical protein